MNDDYNWVEKMFIEFQDMVHWDIVSRNPNISMKFIKNHLDKLSLSAIFEYGCLHNSFIDKNLERIDWDAISLNEGISVQFIEKHKDKINWSLLSENPFLPKDFIVKYWNKLDHGKILENSECAEELFDEIGECDRYLYNNISMNPNISEKFILEHIDKICLDAMFLINEQISEEFIRKFKHKINDSVMYNVLKNCDISEEFALEYIDKRVFIGFFENERTSEDFIRRYMHIEYWYIISSLPSVSEEFIIENIDKVKWSEVSKNPNISIDFIRKYADKLDWKKISNNDFGFYRVDKSVKPAKR